ncbi:MAG: hypothetical protein NTW50_05085 [Candidatus Berkelbacteria bacterium]|nr:hypothetical protein [Candidatus Berkelbacteria bacterium]
MARFWGGLIIGLLMGGFFGLRTSLNFTNKEAVKIYDEWKSVPDSFKKNLESPPLCGVKIFSVVNSSRGQDVLNKLRENGAIDAAESDADWAMIEGKWTYVQGAADTSQITLLSSNGSTLLLIQDNSTVASPTTDFIESVKNGRNANLVKEIRDGAKNASFATKKVRIPFRTPKPVEKPKAEEKKAAESPADTAKSDDKAAKQEDEVKDEKLKPAAVKAGSDSATAVATDEATKKANTLPRKEVIDGWFLIFRQFYRRSHRFLPISWSRHCYITGNDCVHTLLRWDDADIVGH